jgi:hypothetical protein
MTGTSTRSFNYKTRGYNPIATANSWQHKTPSIILSNEVNSTPVLKSLFAILLIYNMF